MRHENNSTYLQKPRRINARTNYTYTIDTLAGFTIADSQSFQAHLHDRVHIYSMRTRTISHVHRPRNVKQKIQTTLCYIHTHTNTHGLRFCVLLYTLEKLETPMRVYEQRAPYYVLRVADFARSLRCRVCDASSYDPVGMCAHTYVYITLYVDARRHDARARMPVACHALAGLGYTGERRRKHHERNDDDDDDDVGDGDVFVCMRFGSRAELALAKRRNARARSRSVRTKVGQRIKAKFKAIAHPDERNFLSASDTLQPSNDRHRHLIIAAAAALLQRQIIRQMPVCN